MGFDELYFSGKGRINRKAWWFSSIGLIVIYIILAIVVSVIFFMLGYNQSPFAMRMLSGGMPLIIIAPYYFLSLKRLHDRSRPEILVLIFILPTVISSVLTLLGISGSMQTVLVLGQQNLAFISNSIGQVVGLISLAVGLWSLIELGFMRGHKGDNQYGRDPSV